MILSQGTLCHDVATVRSPERYHTRMPAPRNPMDRSDLHVYRGPAEEEPAGDPDVCELNGRVAAEHERDVLKEVRLAERAAAADGILSGLIKKPKL